MLLKDNKLINILVVISALIIVFNFAFFVIERSPFQYIDWLINY